MMRIITGLARGVRLETLEGDQTRPTAERVKEAIFSSIQFEIAEKKFLDLFSGSGQMGLEAVSRGASLAVMVDESREAAELIKRNAKKTKLFEHCRVLNCGYAEYLRGAAGRERFDYVYIDPPFGDRMIPTVLKKLGESGVADENTLVFCEDEREELMNEKEAATCPFYVEKHTKYGRIHIFCLRLKKEVEV